MRLWVASWNGDRDLRRRSVAALASMIPTFPALRGGESTSTPWEGPSHVALLRDTDDTPDAAVMTADACCVVDGFPIIDGTRVVPAVDFAGPGSGPEPDRLDGQFGVVQATPTTLAVTADFLGVQALYWCRSGAAHLVGNNVEVLARIIGVNSLDAEAVSRFASMGWVLGRRTLCAGIERVPDGVHWSWIGTVSEPRRRTYVSRSVLAGRQKRLRAPALAQDLQSRLAAVAKTSPRLRCLLSAGLDSRVILALLTEGGIDADYVTQGEPESVDVVAATEIAAMLGVRHEVIRQSVEDVTRDWDRTSRQIVEQNDGMVSLWQSADAVETDSLRTPDSVLLYGLGGGAGRGRLTTWRSLAWRSHRQAVEWLERQPSDGGGLLLPRCVEDTRRHLRAFAEEAADDGFSPPEVPDAFYLFERETGYGAANARKMGHMSPVFVPYFTRPFIEAAFLQSPARRFSEPIHFELLRLLDRRLHEFRVERGYWRSQVPYLNLVRHRWPVKARLLLGLQAPRPGDRVGLLHQAAWIETMRERLQERYLDDQGSDLWGFVDRRAFEAVLAEDAIDRRLELSGMLLDVITLFEYERFRRRAPVLN